MLAATSLRTASAPQFVLNGAGGSWPLAAQLRCLIPCGRGFFPTLGAGSKRRPCNGLRTSRAQDCLEVGAAGLHTNLVDEVSADFGETEKNVGAGPGGGREEEEVVLHTDLVDGASADCGEAVQDVSAAGLGSKSKPRSSKRKGEQQTYLLAAIVSTLGFTALAVAAVVYRFVWQMPASGAVPHAEIFGTFALAVGAAVGMEYWARWAHKALWHASLWHMHKSHHRPRDGPFETNDVFAIINAAPAIALMLYGFLNKGLVPGLCFGAGLGITMFGISYMFVHDGLVHRRFPVGPIAGVPYLQKVAAAHQLHHADLFKGVPYGLFLGAKELEEVGGEQELEKLLEQRARAAKAVAARK